MTGEHVGSHLAPFKVRVRIWFYDWDLRRKPAGNLPVCKPRDSLVEPRA